MPELEYIFSKHNRLNTEKSPYLLQHAKNPVDWYPWGEEAFAKAKEEDKPIFLSIGYSTCHWCHVMERESFEDEEVAAQLNKDYVCIKVDREERPDIDSIYMNVCQAITGHGGWPLTIIMTPDKKPFFAATYLPKNTRGGMMGLMELLPRITEMWHSNRSDILDSGERIIKWLQREEKTAEGMLDEEVFQRAFADSQQNFDARFGGFGAAPKFPSSHRLYFLLRYYYAYGEQQALKMAEKTLESMYRGGIYDHIGFGFSRYSTDARWLVPHFEKMLYDNALLAIAYIEVYQLTHKEIYARIAREIFSYVLRDMTSPEGGFYSAEDADSEGVEGKFYLWTPEQIIELLGESEGNFFNQVYDIKKPGNFEVANIPNLLGGIPKDSEQERLERSRKKLFEAREKRIHPFKDDKILCSWNALMIAALAYASRVLDEPGYLQSARKAAAFIMSKLQRQEDGRLMASYREGETSYPAYADDYAFLIWAMIELYESSYEIEFLRTAIDLNNDLLRYFGDGDKGGLFFYGNDSEQLLIRPKEVYDGAMPSGNSVAALNFLRLARLTASVELEQKAQKQISCFAESINSMPTAYSFLLCAALYAASPDKQIVVVGKAEEDNSSIMLDTINKMYNPFAISIFKEEGETDSNLPEYLKEMNSINGQSTVYICSHFACQEPITSVQELSQCLKAR
ncbi:MAG: thioredoxin domain-containing protein [Syntrophomonadaceae bacterium]|nr:thioredoxin domain-containing protein [Syntrophomonadaceae bacterium]MDD3024569.1 thioredoxin domain-containing protein [Syntrophomonadaceae bacterium]